MQKDRHNIYSKEELLKIIKEGKNAPADMDEFELEALDGLKLLDDKTVLNKLNKEVDEIIVQEKKKEKQRKTIYYFSAAASLLLLVSLIFLFKNEVAVKNEKVVAEVEKPKEENLPQELKSPVQEETPITYEAKEPEQEKTIKQETTVLAESKAKQKQNEGVLRNDNLASNINLEQAPIVAKNSDGYIAQDVDRERKEQEIATTQTFGAASAELKADNLSEQQDQDKSIEVNKSKKVVASMSQPSMAYQSKDEARTVSASPGAPKVDSKKAEEKTKSDLFYANSAAKNKAATNYKEATFINGDSAFAAYAKQNLKISSPNNSGIIVVSFLVNKDGTVSNIEVLKSLAACDVCSKDVIDLIRSIKKWQPAMENGKAITAPKKISLPYN